MYVYLHTGWRDLDEICSFVLIKLQCWKKIQKQEKKL